MCLGFGNQPPGRFETELIPNQVLTMQILIIIALITVPLMLYVKPIIEYQHEKKKHALKASHVNHHELEEPYAINDRDSVYTRPTKTGYDLLPDLMGGSENEKVHSFGDLFIH